MIPRVFVSSTVRDLLHVRDAVRDQLVRLGFQPVMSEHGEIGYLPDRTAADSCYTEAQTCHLGVLIIGKRYGDEHKDGGSVTHNEYRTLLARKIPLVTLVQKDIFTFKDVFEANKGAVGQFPGMDHPANTFGFVSEVMRSEVNNGVSEFHHASDAQDYVRTQFAHLFASLLTERNDPVKAEVKDILAAVTALREELTRQSTNPDATNFLRVSRALLEDSAVHYRKFLEQALGSLELAAKAVIDHKSFDDVAQAHKWRIQLLPDVFEPHMHIEDASKTMFIRYSSYWESGRSLAGHVMWSGYVIAADGNIAITDSAKKLFDAVHISIRSSIA